MRKKLLPHMIIAKSLVPQDGARETRAKSLVSQNGAPEPFALRVGFPPMAGQDCASVLHSWRRVGELHSPRRTAKMHSDPQMNAIQMGLWHVILMMKKRGNACLHRVLHSVGGLHSPRRTAKMHNDPQMNAIQMGLGHMILMMKKRGNAYLHRVLHSVGELRRDPLPHHPHKMRRDPLPCHAHKMCSDPHHPHKMRSGPLPCHTRGTEVRLCHGMMRMMICGKARKQKGRGCVHAKIAFHRIAVAAAQNA